ncbi:TPA: hypothetical protein ACF6TA_004675, partial [Salmonella enterica subsp. enterica serovar Infantis]
DPNTTNPLRLAMQNYDMSKLRKEAITLLAASLKRDSKFYKDDYEAIVCAVNKKTRAELLECLKRQRAIAGVSDREIRRNCQV